MKPLTPTQQSVITLLGIAGAQSDNASGFRISWNDAGEQGYFINCVTVGDYYRAYLEFKLNEHTQQPIVAPEVFATAWETIVRYRHAELKNVSFIGDNATDKEVAEGLLDSVQRGEENLVGEFTDATCRVYGVSR